MLVGVSEDGREVWAEPVETNVRGLDAATRYYDGELVELRLFPSSAASRTPITTAVLRQVSTERLRESTFRAVADAGHATARIKDRDDNWRRIFGGPRLAKRYEDVAAKGLQRRAGRAPQWTPETVLPVVTLYEDLLRTGAPDPYAVLRKEFRLAGETAARGVIQKARTMGLWQPAGKGKRGGRLTPKARRMLAKGS